jgi:hypothetical protein
MDGQTKKEAGRRRGALALTRGVRWPSVLLSALIWLPVPVAFGLLDSNRAPDAAGLLLRGFLASQLAIIATIFLCVSFVMHRLFARQVCRPSRRGFWLYPLESLFFATLFFSFVFTLVGVSERQPHAGDFPMIIFAMAGVWLVTYLITLTTMVCICYPLALFNQWLIQWFYRGRSAPVPS